MSEWSNVNLASLLSFGNGKSRPLDSGNIPVYGGNGIMSYVSHFNYDHETIIIGRVGAYCGATYYENKPIWISDNALSAKAVGEHNTKYLYYLLKNLDLNQFAEGSSHPLLTQKLLNSIETKTALNPNEQKSIASVLSSLDDKIDLLHRQNKTLESMAETLFRQWFIEEAQDEWPEKSLNQYVELNKSSISKKYDFKEIQYLDTGSLTKGKISELQTMLLSEAPSRAKRLVNEFDIIISTVRPDQCHYGICIDPPSNLVVSTGFCVISGKSISPFFIYYLLTSEDMTEYLHSIAEGSTSTYPSLKPEDIGNVLFLYPGEEKLKNFHKLVGSYWNKIHNNYKKIQTLETLRDTLLPKLMSGEVRVQYAEQAIASVA
ncbi:MULTISPECIES: restriction endonuclease subunit S [Enterobacterales]|jgi:type I restriction enzyme S subunit|uniref:Restriction endonuclease subunit S n=5 Tax=Enterobacteriaceae TaxID=543 RepID=A0A839CGP6_9ENTR|nr:MULTISPECIES: restriction endonuclease subunit S [Enterobacterales]EMB8447280.1 restriction endonuclease subunit S [Morganella morganii]MCU3447515.1 restriction endonuclease subunit S [Enterobacter hormaechei subsp. steigerwaltii]MDU4337642.1 restriction endonuclease subunit S [Streptococcus mitis]MDU4542324.1 restriction endonuclease subunit S [Klebsiella michiganensis]POV33593.1 restriction endonuclease subunit S [Leclercia sp. LSNIH5]POW65854.1 restriction endonuclease subunit S [Lecler